jgi:hypothetical protein
MDSLPNPSAWPSMAMTDYELALAGRRSGPLSALCGLYEIRSWISGTHYCWNGLLHDACHVFRLLVWWLA